jgi:hypothetical protein
MFMLNVCVGIEHDHCTCIDLICVFDLLGVLGRPHPCHYLLEHPVDYMHMRTEKNARYM